MRKFMFIAFAIALFIVKPAFNQQVYRLHISQPPPNTITLAESIKSPLGALVSLDMLSIRIDSMACDRATLIDSGCDSEVNNVASD